MARKLKSEKDMVSSGAGAAAAVPRRKALVTRAKHSNTQAETSPTPVVESSAAESTVAESNTPAAAIPQTPAAAAQPSYEEISLLAYSYWEARGCEGGSPDEDWRRAEDELRARALTATA